MTDPVTILGITASILSIIDSISNQLKSVQTGKPETLEKPLRITTELKANRIDIIENGKVIDVITSEDIANLDPAHQNFIETLEKSMTKTFSIWKKVYPKRNSSPDEVVNEQTKQKLNELAEEFCIDLDRIFEYLEQIGKRLEDHYSDVRYACEKMAQL